MRYIIFNSPLLRIKHFPYSPIFVYSLVFLILPTEIAGIGISVPPIKNHGSNEKSKSSLTNLQNCISYEVSGKDIVFITISSVDNLISQSLNLLILDDSGNTLRSHQNLGKFHRTLELIIANSDDVNSFVLEQRDGDDDEQQQQQKIKRSKLIHVCFDNIYNDLSWSFQPKYFDLNMQVNIKNDIKKTDYAIYRQFFTYLEEGKERVVNGNEKEVEESEEGDAISAIGFDTKMNMVQLDLENVVEKLQQSEETLKELLEQEFKLRDANEEIFSGYTFIIIVLCSTIFICGLIQLIYFKSYLKRKKIV